MTEPNWKMKTAYPRDVATKKHVDRVQDRLDRRVDLHGDKLQRLKNEVADLRRVFSDFRLLFAEQMLALEEEEQ